MLCEEELIRTILRCKWWTIIECIKGPRFGEFNLGFESFDLSPPPKDLLLLLWKVDTHLIGGWARLCPEGFEAIERSNELWLGAVSAKYRSLLGSVTRNHGGVWSRANPEVTQICAH